ncbi:MAG: hypothetical protein A3F91_09225 [Flavobacteria bacterium RIFCSPLOWO2_12_FULL_35_11]|nr:MAG: hypothetical protein A3F91_09225 [Flavobacteria bacterium RIFCSPLOWO2_12_FULL_35_11]
MARNVSGTDKFEFNDIQRKYTGEYLNDILKGFYLFIPKLAIFTSFLFLIFSATGVAVGAELFFFNALLLLFVGYLFLYMMVDQRANVACIGVINEARDSQLKYVFGMKQEKIKYYANVGSVVMNFLGKDANEAVQKNLAPSNRVYDMLIDKKTYTMGYLLPGSTGSGKTVTLNTTVFLPAIKSGNGFFYLEGKGDRPITEGIMGFIYQYGRENDVFILDFGAAANGGFTNGLNPLAIGSSKTVGELLKSLIDVMKGDNKWVSDMAIAFLEAILLPLVLLRDINLVIDPKHLQSIQSYDDFAKFDKKQFNITTLLNYLNFQSAIDLLYMMQRMFKDPKFLERVNATQEYGSLKKDLSENIIGRLLRNLTGHNIDVTALKEPVYASMSPDIKRNHPKATEDWINALEIFGGEKFYGNIFNKDEADFEALTAIQTGKIIISILPSMSASPDQNAKMGKMITAVAKSSIGYMLEQGSIVGQRKEKSRDKRYRPRKLPYGYIFDEPSNYANEDISQMSSMVRSIGSDGGGMAIIWTGQSRTDMDKIDDNKKIASEQLLANLGFTQCLNIQDQGWKDVMVKKTGEGYAVRENNYDGVKGGNEDANYREYKREKEKKYEENFFENSLRPQTGESIVSVKGYINEEKLVSWYSEAPVCDLFINRNISSSKLINHFRSLSQSEEFLASLKERIEEEFDDSLIKDDGLSLSFEQEVFSALQLLANTAYPALKGAGDFTLKLLAKNNPKAHGDYTYSTHNINIYNVTNKSREHLIATAVHELAHHIVYKLTEDHGHPKIFYKTLHELLGYAMGLEELYFDYNEAKEKNMIDSNDIRLMERFFKEPRVTKRD